MPLPLGPRKEGIGTANFAYGQALWCDKASHARQDMAVHGKS